MTGHVVQPLCPGGRNPVRAGAALSWSRHSGRKPRVRPRSAAARVAAAPPFPSAAPHRLSPAAGAGLAMQIFVKTLTGKTITLEVSRGGSLAGFALAEGGPSAFRPRRPPRALPPGRPGSGLVVRDARSSAGPAAARSAHWACPELAARGGEAKWP